MSRWKAAAIHLSISAAIGAMATVLIFGVWYPSPWGRAAGADKLVMLLLGVDVVLGPLLTLVVFRSGKKGLRFDLAVISLAQACAFLYGTWVVASARPAFIVASVDRFVLVAANDIDEADLAKARKSHFATVPWSGPHLVGVALPSDVEERNTLMFSAVAGKDIEKFPQYYVDYAAVASALLVHAETLKALREKGGHGLPLIDAWLQKHSRTQDNVVGVPLVARNPGFTVILHRQTGQVLDVLPIDTW